MALKVKNLARGIALASIAAVVFAACSNSGSSTAPSAAASTGASAAAGGSAAAGAMKIGYLPKDIVNQYFAAAKVGIDKGAAESGSTVIQVGPNEPKADLQVPFIKDLTT